MKSPQDLLSLPRHLFSSTTQKNKTRHLFPAGQYTSDAFFLVWPPLLLFKLSISWPSKVLTVFLPFIYNHAEDARVFQTYGSPAASSSRYLDGTWSGAKTVLANFMATWRTCTSGWKKNKKTITVLDLISNNQTNKNECLFYLFCLSPLRCMRPPVLPLGWAVLPGG